MKIRTKQQQSMESLTLACEGLPKPNKKLYIIAHTCKCLDLTIEYYRTPEKAVKEISMTLEGTGYRKAYPSDDPEEYLSEWYEWERENYDCGSEISIELEVIEL